MNPRTVSMQSYADTTLASRVQGLLSTSNGEARLRVECPRRQNPSSSAVIAVGEDGRAAGEYSLRLEYRIMIRRPKP